MATTPFSDEARALARPFHTYAALSKTPEGGDAQRLAGKLLITLFTIGGFVSLTAAGRLVASHVAMTMVFWVFAPLVQMTAATAAIMAIGPRTRLTRSLWLYFVGHGPWLFFLLGLAGLCLFSPNVYGTFAWLLSHAVLPLAMLLVVVWSNVLTMAFFRAGLGLSRVRSAAGVGVYYLVYIGLIASYYLVTNQIQSQIIGVPQ